MKKLKRSIGPTNETLRRNEEALKKMLLTQGFVALLPVVTIVIVSVFYWRWPSIESLAGQLLVIATTVLAFNASDRISHEDRKFTWETLQLATFTTLALIAYGVFVAGSFVTDPNLRLSIPVVLIFSSVILVLAFRHAYVRELLVASSPTATIEAGDSDSQTEIGTFFDEPTS